MGNCYEQWLCTYIKSGGQIAKLLRAFGSAEAVYRCKNEELDRITGLSAETMRVMQILRTEEVLERDVESLHRIDARFLWWEEERFPEYLRQIPEMPFGIFVQGRLPEKAFPCIAVIGTRSCSNYGAELARVFSAELSRSGVGIVSGLAIGIDSIAQEACLNAGGYTLGVLGSGIGVPYPKENWALYKRVKEQGGIVSEYSPGTAGLKHHFPMRNRLISGMADGILVVEAREKSGTMITVDRALEQGRDVYVLPGRVIDRNSVGCNRLIQQGAKLVTGPEDILEELTKRHPGKIFYKEETEQYAFSAQECGVTSKKKKLGLATEEKIVYSLMRLDPKHFDSLVWESGLPPQKLAVLLADLESGGWIRQPTPNYYAVRME